MVDEDIIAGFRAMKEQSQERRARNREGSAELLRGAGIPFESKNDGAHLIVAGVFDFWPGTGLWIRRGSTGRQRGVRGLIKAVRAQTVNGDPSR